MFFIGVFIFVKKYKRYKDNGGLTKYEGKDFGLNR